MKKLIRNGVFETNSSSAHSISISDGDKQFVLDTIYPDQFGVIRVYGGQFGWDFVKFNDAETKLNYAFQDNVDEDLLRKVVMDFTGATEVIFDDKNDGYIDHESCGLAGSVCTDYESIKNFIFNKNSWLFTGNDNSEASPDFYDVPEFRDGKIINPIYSHEFKIDGLKKTVKFNHYPTNEEIDTSIESIMDYNVKMNGEGYFFEDEKSNLFFILSDHSNLYERMDYIMGDSINYENKTILMIRERIIHQIEKGLIDEGIIAKNTPYYEKNNFIKNEILKNPDYIRYVSYQIDEI